MLIVLCGRPCVGKTTVAKALAAFLESQGKSVVVVNEESVGIRHAEGYRTLKSEATTRSTLKSAVERKISRETVTILDSMNYIKGYRYELYCITRAQGTTRVTLFVETPQEVAANWNAIADEPLATPSVEAAAGSEAAPTSASRYTTEIFEGLWHRFEPPDESNRWDSPLFRVDGDADPASLEESFRAIATALVEGKRVKPALATAPTPFADTNYLHVLDKVTQEVVSAVQTALSMGVSAGESVAIPRCSFPVVLTRKPTVPELSRIRRQFIKVNTMRPGDDPDRAGALFVEYLNKNLAL